MKIFIGYEEAHPEMFDVCKASIERFNTSHEIIPLRKSDIPEYTRPYNGESTDFAFTRFLVPYLCDYKEFALFCDGDFLWRDDPKLIIPWISPWVDVSVVKHPMLVTSDSIKMDGRKNKPYEKKYWSSLMFFNNTLCKGLTPFRVNEYEAMWLHRFEWATHIGELPVDFNHLVGYYSNENPKAVHFTNGGPWLEGYRNVDFADEWLNLYGSISPEHKQRTRVFSD
jgi:hypothetical protein